MPYELGELELRHLLALQAIADAGTFWAAAERLGCSQSALSQQIATVERILGTKLINRQRGQRTVTTTEAGRLLLKHAEVIVARLRAVHADFTAFAEGDAGVLRIGTFESSSTHILPPVLQEFRQKWPSIDIHLTELAKDDQLLKLMERGELDLSFSILPLPDGPFASQVLLQDPFVLIVARDAPLALKGRKALSLSQLRNLPLIGFGDGRSMDQMEAYMKSRGVDLNIIFRANYNGTVQGLVATGIGAAIAPLLTVDVRRSDTRVLSPIEGLPPRIIALGWHKDRYQSSAAKAFVETARRLAPTLINKVPRTRRR